MVTATFSLPSDILTNVFDHLGLYTASSTASRVSKTWYKISNSAVLWQNADLVKLLPYKRFNIKTWQTYINCEKLNINPANAPLFKLTKQIFLSLKDLCTHIEGDEGLIELTMPKGFSLQKLSLLGQRKDDRLIYIIQGYSPRITSKFCPFDKYFDPGHMVEWDTSTLEKTKRIIITGNLLKGSQGKALETLARYQKSGYRTATVLQASTLIFLKDLLKDNSDDFTPAMTVCREKLDGSHMLVGNFTGYGLEINKRQDDQSPYIGTVVVYEIQS